MAVYRDGAIFPAFPASLRARGIAAAPERIRLGARKVPLYDRE